MRTGMTKDVEPIRSLGESQLGFPLRPADISSDSKVNSSGLP